MEREIVTVTSALPAVQINSSLERVGFEVSRSRALGSLHRRGDSWRSHATVDGCTTLCSIELRETGINRTEMRVHLTYLYRRGYLDSLFNLITVDEGRQREELDALGSKVIREITNNLSLGLDT